MGGRTPGPGWSHVLFVGSTWAVVSFVALVVVGLAWSMRLKPQALTDARAQRQEIVLVLARLADAQARDKLDALEPVAAHLAQSWASREPRALQRELDSLRTMIQVPTLVVVSSGGRPLAVSPLTAADGSSNLDLRYGDRPFLQEAIRTERTALSGIVFGRVTRDFIVGAAVPIRTERGVVGYLLGSFRLRGAIEAIEHAAAGPGGWLVMIDADQQAIFLDRRTGQVTQQDWKGHPVVKELARRGADGLVAMDGDDWLVTQAAMPTLRVNLVYVGSVGQILAAERAVLLTLGATLLVSVATSLVVSTVMAVRFVRESRMTAQG